MRAAERFAVGSENRNSVGCWRSLPPGFGRFSVNEAATFHVRIAAIFSGHVLNRSNAGGKRSYIVRARMISSDPERETHIG